MAPRGSHSEQFWSAAHVDAGCASQPSADWFARTVGGRELKAPVHCAGREASGANSLMAACSVAAATISEIVRTVSW